MSKKPRKLVSFDWAMKKLLRSKANFVVLEGFLSELLNEQIRILEILESESNKATPFDKYNRLDIKVKNSKGEIIIIEVQYDDEYDYFQRMLYASSKAVCEHLHESDNYLKVVKVISVHILYFALGHGKDYVYHGTTTFRGIHEHDELQLSECQRRIYQLKNTPAELYPEYYLLKVNSFNDLAKDTLDEWIYFLKHEQVKSGSTAQGLKEAEEILDFMKLSETERQAYDRHIDALRHKRSSIDTALDKGEQIGIKKGEKIGIKKGEKIGIEKVALSLLKMGHDTATIAQATGLTRKQISLLRQKID